MKKVVFFFSILFVMAVACPACTNKQNVKSNSTQNVGVHQIDMHGAVDEDVIDKVSRLSFDKRYFAYLCKDFIGDNFIHTKKSRYFIAYKINKNVTTPRVVLKYDDSSPKAVADIQFKTLKGKSDSKVKLFEFITENEFNAVVISLDGNPVKMRAIGFSTGS